MSYRLKFIGSFEEKIFLVSFRFGLYLELIKIVDPRGYFLTSYIWLQIYHFETVTSTVLKIIFRYQHKLAYCFYSVHIKIKIFEVIIMSKYTEFPMVSGRNYDDVTALFLLFHYVNYDKT